MHRSSANRDPTRENAGLRATYREIGRWAEAATARTRDSRQPTERLGGGRKPGPRGRGTRGNASDGREEATSPEKAGHCEAERRGNPLRTEPVSVEEPLRC